MVETFIAPGLRIVDTDEHEVIDLDNMQGLWTPEQYLRLTRDIRRYVEFTNGFLEILPWPTDRHQGIMGELAIILRNFLRPRGGKILFGPLRLQLREGKFREPDLLVLRDAKDPRRRNAYWLGADLVAEIVSPDNPERDLVVKRADYAEAGIPEYWIVNPQDETFTVLTLDGETYVEHGVFRRGDNTSSILLPDFAVAVSDVFDAD